MDDYISRQAALEAAMTYCPDDDGSCSKAGEDIRDLLDELESIPPADVRPVVRGVWEPGETIFFCGAEHTAPRTCSVCGRSASDEPWYFCPNCGADMRLKPETEMRCNHENGNV